MIAGDLPMPVGAIGRAGGLGIMRQFIGMIDDGTTLNDLAMSLVDPRLRAEGARLVAAEAALHAADAGEKAQLAYANALATWGEAGGYDAEVLFDTVSVLVLDLPWES